MKTSQKFDFRSAKKQIPRDSSLKDLSSDLNQTEEIKGLIFDIQAHSVHDGPGTRTTVFLSGCPLKCEWCCNPEGLSHQPVIRYIKTLCCSCGKCAASCKYNAISFTKETGPVFDRTICDKCRTFDCITSCYRGAIIGTSALYTPSELMRIFRRDRQFWGARGGVTFSGGDPFFQKEFLLEIVKQCRKAYIHVALETSLHVDSCSFGEILKHINWIFADIKHMNPEQHKKLCGVDNRLILKNFEILAHEHWDGVFVPRIPIIPGFNDDEDNIKNTAAFIKELGLELINILPFHRLGESKYRQLGLQYGYSEQVPPDDPAMNRLKKIIESFGLTCYTGYNTPF